MNDDAGKTGWTDERVELLRTLWAEGLSASQIAQRLGGGVSRNAVIGKVHRLKLSGRAATPRKTSPRQRQTRQPSHPGRVSRLHTVGATALKNLPDMESAPPEPEVEPIHLAEIASGERVNLLQLSDRTCRWPIGDPGEQDFCFCGLMPRRGSPYCEHHARVAYQPVQDRRRRHAG